MTTEIYTYGYHGRSPQELDQIAQELDAVVFDVRFSPRSRDARWSGWNLEAILGPDRYRHVRALGNANYKGGPVEIVDLAAGIEEIERSPRPVILMCVCKDPAKCHRTVVAERLRDLGYDVKELTDEPIQLKLC